MTTVVSFTVDLTAHEGTRLDALGPLWDPAETYLGEAQAHQMLYAHLDPEQQATYDVLIAASALPDTCKGR